MMKTPNRATSCGLLVCLLADTRAPEAPLLLFLDLLFGGICIGALVLAGDEDAQQSHFLRLASLPFG